MTAIHGLEPGKRAALLVVEVQNGITNPAYEDSPLAHQVAARGIVARINGLAEVFREVNAPVVFCTIAAASPDWSGFRVNCALAARIRHKGRLVSGSEYAAIHDDLVVAPSDIVGQRSNGMAPFTGSTLDVTLRGYDIDTVVLTGVSTNIALPGAATEAVALSYNVVLAEDCTAGATPETHQAQITMHLPLLATIRPAEKIIEALRGARASRPPR
jgi:nicotinamidase-related amidase